MSIWIDISLISLVIAGLALWPILRRTPKRTDPDTPDSQSAIAVEKRLYQQRLRELEADSARGVLDDHAAAEARAELGRALIASAEQAEQLQSKHSSFIAPLLVATIVLAIGAAYGLYWKIGAPALHRQLPQSIAEINDEQVDIETAIARVEKQMQQTPDDVRGWQVLAPIYRRLGQNDKAIHALRQIIALDGPSVETRTELAELLLLVDGPANRAEAVALLNAARQSAPREIRPQFMLAIVAMQEQRFTDAATLWAELLARVGRDVASDEPWVEIAREGLAQATNQPRSNPATSGPNQSDIDAASQMSDDERQEMIKNMVESLAQRLQNDGGTLDEWQQLVRALGVLGENTRATQALAQALQNLSSATDRQAMEILASELGLQIDDNDKNEKGSQ